MATIYRFIVEQKTSGGASGGRKEQTNAPTKKTPSKKGRYVSIFGGEKGGVEHNRKLRAINPLLNKVTSGYWEKGMRLGRAGLGLVQRNTETGKIGFSGPAVAIIIAFVIQTIMKYWNKEIQKAQKINAQNYKMLENGTSAIHGSYEVSADFWTGRLTYNQNK